LLFRRSNKSPSGNRKDAWLYASAPGAVARGRFVGKWMPRVSADVVDDLWSQIASATERGELGSAAKVSTLLNNESNPHGAGASLHVICVYTADCRDADDVGRVLAALRQLGITERLSYKEDGATYANIYGRGAALYVAQPGSNVPDRRRDPIPLPGNGN
jgi:hypothetical protein